MDRARAHARAHRPTPSQTVGPFYGYALPFTGGGEIAPAGHPDSVTVHGHVYDGAGQPVPDALLEFWQADPDGARPTATGTLGRAPGVGAGLPGSYTGRDGVGFTGFGRVPTDAEGHWSVRTLPPGAVGGAAPYVSVCVFARGLLHHLFTRVYFPQHAERHATDPLLASLDPARRRTLVAVRERDRVFRFDIRIQAGDGRSGELGEPEATEPREAPEAPEAPEETVFLEFR